MLRQAGLEVDHKFYRHSIPAQTANSGLFLSSNLPKRASASALALVLYYLPILGRTLEKLKTSTRQVEGVTIVNLSGRITLGEASVVRFLGQD
jgi:hypothetical protein